MRIAHLSDIHFQRFSWNPFRLTSKRLLGTLNWLFMRRQHFFEEQLEPLPELFKELGVDLILFGGDFSTTSLLEEFAVARKWVDQMNIKWYATAGNHDHYTRRSCRKKHFYRYFTNERSEINDPVEFFTLKEHRVEAHKINEGNWWLVILDTAMATGPHSSEGLFSHTTEKHLNEVLSMLPKDAKIIMLNHFPLFQYESKRRRMVRAEALRSLLEKEPRVRMYLHGHTHRHSIADLQVSGLPIVLDSGSCIQGRKGAWNLIDIDDREAKITTYRFDHKWKKAQEDQFAWTR